MVGVAFLRYRAFRVKTFKGKPEDERKMDPRWPKMEHRWPKMAPRWTQDGPTWPQDGPKMSPRGGQEGLKRGPKRLQIGLPRLSNIEAPKGKDQVKVNPKTEGLSQTQTASSGPEMRHL